MTGIEKGMYPDGTTASTEGLLDHDGTLIMGNDFTQAEVDSWNGVKPAPVVKAVTKPKAKPTKKKSTKAKKKTVWKTMKSAFE